ncbi:hypothetical protein [Kitasatospora griseola]|uniref:hypothetical protein n=1 Tax=Kitasatospora griseola TaxID=2064 RepID=UPI00380B0934
MAWVYRESVEQIGWPEPAAAEQRGRAVVFAADYGEAGALGRYSGAHGLPAPYSGHRSYADCGPPPDSATGTALLARPAPYPKVERAFTICREVARVDNGHGLAHEEQHTPVLLCAGPVEPWCRRWPRLRHFY